MESNIELELLENEVKEIEKNINSNINKLNIIYILIDNNSIEATIKKKTEIKNNVLNTSELKYILHETKKIDIDNEYVEKNLVELIKSQDLSKFIL